MKIAAVVALIVTLASASAEACEKFSELVMSARMNNLTVYQVRPEHLEDAVKMTKQAIPADAAVLVVLRDHLLMIFSYENCVTFVMQIPTAKEAGK